MSRETSVLSPLRNHIRDHTLATEAGLTRDLASLINLDENARKTAQTRAADFVRKARANAVRSGLIDKFLQEYGLSTAEGVTLMRLAEALLRTPDAATANSLIEDKIEAGDWAAHKGKSPFPLVNFSTRALMLTAAWLDDVEAKDPLRRMAKATKDALDRLGEPVIRASVAQAMRIMGEHFVLGETIEEAVRRGRKFSAAGYQFSFDMLGEAAHTAADAEKYFNDYADAIDEIARHADAEKSVDNPGISVKLSALHPRYEYGKKERVLKELGERTASLARRAKAANIGFNIDAEEADRLDLSLDIIEQLMRDPMLADWRGFGVVVQAYQRRAPFVLDWLAALARDTGRRMMVRLVKGAYWDSEIKRAQVMGLESYPVYTRKTLTDLSYVACARKILSATDAFYPQFATHNALTATTVMEMAGDYDDYELQRLHGMGEALHDSLIEDGARSRIYAPVGGHKELLPYLVRRLLENGANSSFVNQLIDPDLSVEDIVADPIEEFASLDPIENPGIPAPRDHLGGRVSAQGWDETDPGTVESLLAAHKDMPDAIAAHPIIVGDVAGAETQSVRNPADREKIVGDIQNSAPADVAAACEAAAAFAPEWAATPAAHRADMLRRASKMLEERGEFFMALAVAEAGKTWPDAVAEIREAVDFLRYYADECEKLRGEPLGVVACISPWNFPLAIFLGQVSASLAAGNCVIAKPAEQTPLIAYEAVKLLHEAGAPPSALQFAPGDGPSVGGPLVENDHIAGVVFTGSTATAQRIKRTLVDSGRHDSALIAETGGINAMIIDSTALLEQAVTDTVASAFQSAGQRCSACRVVCVQEDVFDRFQEMLAGAMAELAVGDPALLATDVGPVIDAESRENIERHLTRLGSQARLIATAHGNEDGADGTFIRPAAYEIESLSDLKEEIFGPVLHVVRYSSDRLVELVHEINGLGFGLTMGVHTRIDETMHAITRRAQIGNVYVNRNQIGAVVGVQPFGGEALSGTGPKAGGPHYLHALTRRSNPVSESMLSLDDAPLNGTAERALAHARDAYGEWSLCDRVAVVEAALQQIDDLTDASRRNILDTAHAAVGNRELPGPTGESNTLKLRGRGVALCLGGDAASDGAQILTAVAAGNAVICGHSPTASEIIRAFDDAGAPERLIATLNGAVPEAVLLNDSVRLVAYDGGAEGRARLEQVIKRRSGAIIPVVSTNDPPWRFCTERTLTINTTAAGGDVRLLSLNE